MSPLWRERLKGWGRLVLLLLSLPVLAMLGMAFFEDANPFEVVQRMRETSALFLILPSGVGIFLTPWIRWAYFQHLLAPLGVFLMALLASARYVQDTYDLLSYKTALRYVLASMFGVGYPRVEIDGGRLVLKEEEENLLDKVGGPGYAIIQPGNAVTFRTLHRPSRIAMNQGYFMLPFETFGPMADLSDQHGHKDEVWAVTRDGIQVFVRNIQYRYRLIPNRRRDGTKVQRSIQDPYPFSAEAMEDMAYNRSAGDGWAEAVGRMITSEIKDFISTHTIDYLTAPRQDDQEPRRDLRMQLFTPGISQRLRRIGTELIWIDAGHLDILEISEVMQENVDASRFAYWATRYIGQERITKAEGEALRTALQERGRVEAQAELLQQITDSLRGIEMSGTPTEAMRKMILVHTAQILDGLTEAGRLTKEKE